MFKKIILIGLVVFIAIQFIQPARNTSNQVLATDITRIYVIPDSVQSLLKIACYDCHSNNTIYPLYSRIQPGAWLMANHVKNGKADLNFSEFGSYSLRRQRSKLKSIVSQVNDDEMPLWSYKLMHKDANLSKEQKELIIDWATKAKDSITARN